MPFAYHSGNAAAYRQRRLANTIDAASKVTVTTSPSRVLLVLLNALEKPERRSGSACVAAASLGNFTWSATTSPGPRQVAFAKKLQAYPDAKGSEPIVACAPFYDFLYVLKHVVEKEKSFDTAAVKRGLDEVKNFAGLQGTINFTAANHRALSADALCMARVASAKSPKAMGAFRERAPGA